MKCSRLSMVFLVLLVSCTETPLKQAGKSIVKNDSLPDTLPVEVPAKPDYTAFIYTKKGTISDSMAHGSSLFKYIHTDQKQSFPHGLACFQQPLGDSVLGICDPIYKICEKMVGPPENNDTMYCKIEVPMVETFEPTPGKSFFDGIDLRNFYFFVTLVDSTGLFLQDTQYGLLCFLRLKYQKQKNNFHLSYGWEDCVNVCEYMEIDWKKPLTVNFLENNRNYSTTIRHWHEVWACGQKYDYAPEYPVVDLQPLPKLEKSFLPYKEEDEYHRWMDSPDFVFSYLRFDETKTDPFQKLQVKSYPLQLMSSRGFVRKGRGLDFDHDGHADVFWYNRYEISGFVFHRFELLYLKLQGKWVPYHYQSYSEYSSLGNYEFDPVTPAGQASK